MLSYWVRIELQENPSFIAANLSLVGAAVAECLKHASSPVRLAAERCALHSFQLTKGEFLNKHQCV